ncbi:MAG: SLC13 family permease, partial [Edwardsiella piscicida]
MEATPLTAAVASPPSQRGLVIIALDIALLLLLLNTLPFDAKANTGLALTVFIGVLWLTEAVHVTITALLVPLLAIGFGLLDAGGALKSFSNPTIFLFFGGFVLATALHVQGLDRLIANRLLLLAGGRMATALHVQGLDRLI